MGAVGGVRRFEVVRGEDVLADGAEFATEHGHPAAVVDRTAPMPVVYTAAAQVSMVYPGASLRWIDEDGS